MMSGTGERFKKSLAAKNFSFRDENLASFTKPQWQWLPFLVLVVFRSVVMVYAVSLLIAAIALFDPTEKWFIYMTDWAYVLATIYWVILTVVSIHCYMSSRDTKESTTFTNGWKNVYSMHWLFFSIASITESMVSITYWPMVFSASDLEHFPENWFSINEHGIVFLLIVLDVFLSQVKVRWQHFYPTAIVLLCYAVFHIIYVEVSSSSAYEFLNHQENPGTAIPGYIFQILIAAPLFQMLWYGLYKLRMCLKRRNGAQDSHEMQMA